MRRIHPLPAFFYLLIIIVYTMFTEEIIVLSLSLFGAFFSLLLINPKKMKIKSFLRYFILFTLIVLLNPLFNQNGEPILIIGKLKITKEAIMNGIRIGLMIIAIIIWFDLFNQIITTEKFIYLFGNIAPASTLLLSMGLKYLPIFYRQSERINQVQRTMGIYEEGFFKNIKNKIKTYLALISWSLENAVDTASSMKARGYGIGKRSRYILYEFRKEDFLFILLCLVFTLYLVFGEIYNFPYRFIGLGLIFSWSAFLEIKENLKWHYLKLKI